MQPTPPEPSAAEQPAEAPPKRRPRVAIIVAVLAAVLAAVATSIALFVVLNKKPETSTAPTVNEARERKSREVPAVTFTDVTAASGVKFKHKNGFTPYKLLPETMGGGVACFDYDGDGRCDILFVNSCPWPGHAEPMAPKSTPRLYRNLGGFKFEDVTAAAGLEQVMYGMGVAVGDYNNDGRPDVFISCVGKHRLFRNIDGKRFEDVTATAGVGGPGELPNAKSLEDFANLKDPIPFGSSATFVDYDADGRLDLFVCHYVTWSPAIDRKIVSTLEGGKRTYVQPKDMDGSQCTLFHNLGGGKFADVSAAAGVQVWSKAGTDAGDKLRPVGKALGVIAWDADEDGYPDLYVANDTVRNFFFDNKEKDGQRVFFENGVRLGAAYPDEGKPRGGMGIDWGEFAPGRCAAAVANFANEPVTFVEKNRGNLNFSDSAFNVGLVGTTRNSLKFGTLFLDYDNDGRLDLLLNNGHIDPDIASIQRSQTYAQPPQLFWNTGDATCYFEPATEKAAGADLFKPLVGRGSAFADLDGDGDLDVVLAANGGEARVLRNDAPSSNKSIRLELKGDGVKSNRSAIGAVVTVEAGGQKVVRPITGGRGYLSQSELVLTVGVGTAAKADTITVRWPGKDAATETWTNLAAGTTHVLEQGKGEKK